VSTVELSSSTGLSILELRKLRREIRHMLNLIGGGVRIREKPGSWWMADMETRIVYWTAFWPFKPYPPINAMGLLYCIGHEASHIKWSGLYKVKRIADADRKRFHRFVNAIEDIRVDRLSTRQYGGFREAQRHVRLTLREDMTRTKPEGMKLISAVSMNAIFSFDIGEQPFGSDLAKEVSIRLWPKLDRIANSRSTQQVATALEPIFLEVKRIEEEERRRREEEERKLREEEERQRRERQERWEEEQRQREEQQRQQEEGVEEDDGPDALEDGELEEDDGDDGDEGQAPEQGDQAPELDVPDDEGLEDGEGTPEALEGDEPEDGDGPELEGDEGLEDGEPEEADDEQDVDGDSSGRSAGDDGDEQEEPQAGGDDAAGDDSAEESGSEQEEPDDEEEPDLLAGIDELPDAGEDEPTDAPVKSDGDPDTEPSPFGPDFDGLAEDADDEETKRELLRRALEQARIEAEAQKDVEKQDGHRVDATPSGHVHYEARRRPRQGSINGLANRLKAVLRHNALESPTTGHRRGRFDSGQAHRLQTGNVKVFKRPGMTGGLDYVFGLLVDVSDSMYTSDEIRAASEACVLVAEALERAGLGLFVVLWGTKIVHVKPLGEPLRRHRGSLGEVFSTSPGEGTVEGPALAWALDEFRLAPASAERLLIQITDGDSTDAPVAEVLLAEGENAGIKALTIRIGGEPAKHYPFGYQIEHADELARLLPKLVNATVRRVA
jgi:flagellar biosynthesis GTPase FlhF